MAIEQRAGNSRDVYNHLVGLNDRMFEALSAGQMEEYNGLKSAYDKTYEDNYNVVQYLERVKTSNAELAPRRAAAANRALPASFNARIQAAGISPDFHKNPAMKPYWQLQGLDGTTSEQMAASYRDPSNASAMQVRKSVLGVRQQLTAAGLSDADLGARYVQYKQDFGDMVEERPDVAEKLYGASLKLGVSSPASLRQLHQGLRQSLEGATQPGGGNVVDANRVAANMVDGISEMVRGSSRSGGMDRAAKMANAVQAVNLLAGNGLQLTAETADKYSAKIADIASSFDVDKQLNQLRAASAIAPEDMSMARDALFTLHLGYAFSDVVKPETTQRALGTLKAAFPGAEKTLDALADGGGLVSGFSRARLDDDNPVYTAMYAKGKGAEVPKVRGLATLRDTAMADVGAAIGKIIPNGGALPSSERTARASQLVDSMTELDKAFTSGDPDSAAKIAANLKARLADPNLGTVAKNVITEAYKKATEISTLGVGRGTSSYSNVTEALTDLSRGDISRPGADGKVEVERALRDLVKQYASGSADGMLTLGGTSIRIDQLQGGAVPKHLLADTTEAMVNVADRIAETASGTVEMRAFNAIQNADTDLSVFRPLQTLLVNKVIVRDPSSGKLTFDKDALTKANANYASRLKAGKVDLTLDVPSIGGRVSLSTPEGRAAFLATVNGINDPQAPAEITRLMDSWKQYSDAHSGIRQTMEAAGITDEYLESRPETQKLMQSASGLLALQGLLPGGTLGIKPEVAARLAQKAEFEKQRTELGRAALEEKRASRLGREAQGAASAAAKSDAALMTQALNWRAQDVSLAKTNGSVVPPLSTYLEKLRRGDAPETPSNAVDAAQ